jgi:hypothetical protein
MYFFSHYWGKNVKSVCSHLLIFLNVYILKTNCNSYTFSLNYTDKELTKVIFILIYFLGGDESNYAHMLNIHDHVTSQVISNCVHMSKQTWIRDMRLYLLDRYM